MASVLPGPPCPGRGLARPWRRQRHRGGTAPGGGVLGERRVAHACPRPARAAHIASSPCSSPADVGDAPRARRRPQASSAARAEPGFGCRRSPSVLGRLRSRFPVGEDGTECVGSVYSVRQRHPSSATGPRPRRPPRAHAEPVPQGGAPDGGRLPGTAGTASLAADPIRRAGGENAVVRLVRPCARSLRPCGTPPRSYRPGRIPTDFPPGRITPSLVTR